MGKRARASKDLGKSLYKVPELQERTKEEVLILSNGGEAGGGSQAEVTLTYSRERPELD